MYLKIFLFVYLIFIISIHVFAQNEIGKYDNIKIKVNIPIKQPNISFPIQKIIRKYQHDFPEQLFEYKCIDSTAISTFNINIMLTSGTSWDFYNPPKKPMFFLFRLLLNSKSKVVVDRFNYVRFLSIWETIDGIPYDLIDRIKVDWNCWNVKNLKALASKKIIENIENRIIEKGGIKCVSIEYEIIPDSTGMFQITGSQIK